MDQADLDYDRTMPAQHFVEAVADEAAVHVISYESGTELRRVTVGSAPLIVGRCAPADFHVDSARVSRQHCRLQVVDGMLIVTDLGSTNGTFVDGHKVQRSAAAQHGSTIMLGTEALTYERMTSRDLRAARASERDRENAATYLQDLLPLPLTAGAVRTQWLFLPSSELGGTGFGYRFIRPDLFAGFFLEVAGTGTRAAMHAIALMSFLRQREAADLDFTDCGSVLRSLETAFPARNSGGLFFSVSYFTFDLTNRNLSYAACGREPVLLTTPADGEVVSLPSRAKPVGLGDVGGINPVTIPIKGGANLLFINDAALDILESTEYDIARTVGTTDHRQIPAILHQAFNETGEACSDVSFVTVVLSFP